MILRAKAVLPVAAPPIEDGAVFIAGRKIHAVAPWKDLRPHLREKALDLGEVILLPGLINAHCHLDYTDMAGEFRRPRPSRTGLPPSLSPRPPGVIPIMPVPGCTARINS